MKFNTTFEAYSWLLKKAEEAGLSKTDLAKKIDCHPQQISNNLRRGGVKLSTVQELADALNLKVELSLTDKF